MDNPDVNPPPPQRNIIELTAKQLRAWKAASELGGPAQQRKKAIQVLVAEEDLSLPSLFRALKSANPIVICSAAVALHKLKKPEGLSSLIDQLRWRLTGNPAIEEHLYEAFIEIGSPDTPRALLTVWHGLQWATADLMVLTMICRVWKSLRDPMVIPALVLRAKELPRGLFLDTIKAFGELAIETAEPLTHHPEAEYRLIGVQALGAIGRIRGFAPLIPVLRDPDMTVRYHVADAMISCGGFQSSHNELLRALEEGFGSVRGVLLLRESSDTRVSEAFVQSLTRWRVRKDGAFGLNDSVIAAILGALFRRELSYGQQQRVSIELTYLLSLDESAEVSRASCMLLKYLSHSAISENDRHSALINGITSLDEPTREMCAEQLKELGNRLGSQFTALLAENRYQPKLLTRLRSLIQGGKDPADLARDTLNWLSRVRRDTIEQLSGGKAGGSAAAYDLQLSQWTLRLLQRGLGRQEKAVSIEDSELQPAIEVCTTAVVALSKLDPECIRRDDSLLRKALIQVSVADRRKQPTATNPLEELGLVSADRDTAEPLRMAAMSCLLRGYGSAVFPLMLEALHHPRNEVRRTAIAGLSELLEPRALPHLEIIAANRQDPLAVDAAAAMSTIRSRNPEMMTLLRASSASDSRPETLLRPAMPVSSPTDPAELLRPGPTSEISDRADASVPNKYEKEKEDLL